ncbi:MAG: hypothetical protein PHZ26_03100 [Candidatus Gracilibacteria bacterium]|nr:hypothetical protein [Candidatus Gracilibacteria bacterium]MDD2908715.1 hypothetical protein [Candidatus Gracilibacteria bacterium]
MSSKTSIQEGISEGAISLESINLENIKERIAKSKNHQEFSKYVNIIIETPENKEKLISIIKEYLAKLEKFDINDKISVSMIQILAKSFGLDVYMDGLYGRQTQKAVADILKLNQFIEPPILILPLNVDEKNLANYRKGIAEAEAVAKLENEYKELISNPSKKEKFEQSVLACKIDIQNIQFELKGIKKKELKKTVDGKGIINQTNIESTAVNQEKKDGLEVIDTTESKINKILKKSLRATTIDGTYNKIENKIYLTESGNPKSPIIIDLKAKNIDFGSPDFSEILDSLISKEKLNLNNLALPDWTLEKKEGMTKSAKEMIDIWETLGITDIDALAKAQKLRIAISKIDELDINNQFKINLVDKYINGGSDATSRFTEVITVLGKMKEINAIYSDGEIKDLVFGKKIEGTNNNEKGQIYYLIENLTTYKINTIQFIDGLYPIVGCDIVKEEINKEFIKKMANLCKYNKPLYLTIINKFGTDKQSFEKLKSITDNLTFVEEYSKVDFSTLNKDKDEKIGKFLNKMKEGLDNTIMNSSIETAKEIFKNIKNIKEEDNNIMNMMKEYKFDEVMYSRITSKIGNSIISGKTEYGTIYNTLIDFGDADTDVKNLSLDNIKKLDKKGADTFLNSILEGSTRIGDNMQIKKLDKIIGKINTNKNTNNFIKEELKTIVRATLQGIYDINVVVDNLEYVSNFKNFENKEELISKAIKFFFSDVYKQQVQSSPDTPIRMENAPVNFKEAFSKMMISIDKLKGDKDLKIISSTQKFNLLLDLAQGKIKDSKYEGIAASLNELQDKVNKNEIKEEQAKLLADSLISDKLTVSGIQIFESLSDYEKSSITSYEKQIKGCEEHIDKIEKGEDSYIKKGSKDYYDILKLINLSQIEIDKITQNKRPAKKLTEDDYIFTTQEFLKPDNKAKFTIPTEAFQSESIRNDYQNTIEKSLLSGEINKNDVRFIFEKLLVAGNEFNAKFNSLTPIDKQSLFENMITGVLSASITNYKIGEVVTAGTKEDIEKKVSFILDNNSRLAELNTIPNGVNEENYKKMNVVIRESLFAGYIADETKFNKVLEMHKTGKDAKLTSGAQGLYIFAKYGQS